MKKGFDNEKYLKIQSEHIKERISKFGDKLYLEFGGKLFDDYHASRVLPGFQDCFLTAANRPAFHKQEQSDKEPEEQNQIYHLCKEEEYQQPFEDFQNQHKSEH